MTRCVVLNADGTVLVEPEGTECYAGQLVLFTNTEFQQNTASPFRLSLADGGAVAAAILLVWASAYAFRAAAKSMSSGDPEHD